ncbi:MAG TPA: MFS transporter, partial [Afipia sp.]|nr:MFS transporter [Afipia sp.]
FRAGGNIGSAVGPVLAALIVVPFGQGSIAWFSLVAALAIVVLWQIGRWYRPRVAQRKVSHAVADEERSSARTLVALTVLMV